MTKLKNFVVRPGRATLKDILVSKITFFLAAITCIVTLTSGTVSCRSLTTTENTCVMATQPKTVVVTLSTAFPGASVSIDMDAAFVASFPEAFVTAQLSAEGSQLSISVYGPPATGRHDVATVTVSDASGAGGASFRVSMRDGVVEVVMTDI